ncbi:MAG: ABC transporter ATP-binding protein/permease [Clostridia bacterium]|nr:ABC transporter ATP-binding protein/permease [Clostridia bacterium]
MLEISNIKKDYVMKDETVSALKGINICFRKSEFVSILGPSGCGKTTLLNIIGGLDRYTDGDLIIEGKSTKQFKDRDWDTYRNHSIGFVFQSYNLIPHQTALKNVELALSIGGIPRKERRARALEALKKVGLEEQINKKPNQMSGGQCQRVAIARAIVNNPEIILADEPTGALDSKTSVQVMDILKEIAQDRLVIMVTHNPELAETYSTRIITMKDGEVLNDTNPVSAKEKKKLIKDCEERQNKLTEKEKKQKAKKSSMSLWSTFLLSGSNLLTKKKRTFITSLACSIGIIGIAVILSVSNGMHAYVKKIEQDSMSVNYIAISAMSLNMETNIMDKVEMPEYPEKNELYPYKEEGLMQYQKLSSDYIDYIEQNINGDTEKTNLVTGISYSRNITLYRQDGTTKLTDWSEIIDNTEFLTQEYDALATVGDKVIPTEINEVSLIIDKYNRIPTTILDDLGVNYDATYSALSYDDILGKELTIKYAGITTNKEYNVKIISILRQKPDSSAWLSTGVGYTKAMAEDIVASAGAVAGVSSMLIYPKDFDAKEQIKQVLDNWNNSEIYKLYGNEKDAEGNFIADQYKVNYTDVSELLVGMLGDLIDICTYVLVAFSSVSLIVSSIMIAIITYASVIERIKEIGTIRSLGGRKKDIANIFRTEACTIGAISAIIALIITLIINIMINIVLGSLVGVTTIAKLSFGTAAGMFLLSVGLNLIASLIPASIAAKKDPVLALRTE